MPRFSDPADLPDPSGLDYIVVAEPRERFESELEKLEEGGARLLTPTEALQVLCGADEGAAIRLPAGDDAPYSIDDALAAFERLFDRKRLLEFLLDVSVRAAEADAGSIMLYSEQAEELYIAYATGLSERIIRNTRQKVGDGIAGGVAKERKGRLIRDVGHATLYGGERDRPGIYSAISVPLEFEGRLVGVLNVSSSTSDRPLTVEGFNTLDRLSARISRLLHESAMLREAQVRHEEMNLRQSVGRLAEATTSTTGKFSMVARLLGELVGADTVEMFVGTHEGDWLVLGGSNRRVSSAPDMIRCDRGAISRSYLERRTVVLTEARTDDDDSLTSSFVFTPLFLTDTLGVLMLEFGERGRLDEFIVIKDSVTLELSRFVASERKERRLRRELVALGKVSESAPALLTCRSVDELCDTLARVVADALECARVSVRLQPDEEARGRMARFEGAGRPSQSWIDEDEDRFLTLKKKGEPFALAFLDFQPDVAASAPSYHSVIGVPIEIEGRFAGGIIAYDRHSGDALDGSTFSDLDSNVVSQIVAVAVPVLRTLLRAGGAEALDETSYDSVIAGNLIRMRKIVETEMARADRYHHAFSLLLLRIPALDALFDEDKDRAQRLVGEITSGIQTRTRKTDHGAWIRRDTFAMLTLEGSKRVKFLVSRLMLYLIKDCATGGLESVSGEDLFVGRVVYPGVSRTPDALLAEAEASLAPYAGDEG